MLMHANGECCPDDDHGGDGIAPWSIDQGPGTTITMGAGREDHFCDENDEECECEQYGFSWSACDGCGSSLGGDRFLFTVFWEESNVQS